MLVLALVSSAQSDENSVINHLASLLEIQKIFDELLVFLLRDDVGEGRRRGVAFGKHQSPHL